MSRVLILTALLAAFVTGCKTPRYTYHTRYEARECREAPQRTPFAEWLVSRGYLRSAESKGPMTVFHKPNIVKKSILAADPYEDRAGDVAVAVCDAPSPSYLLAEESRSCQNKKNCTEKEQAELRAYLDGLGCKTSVQNGRSEAWELEDRQDWNRETCAAISQSLSF